MKLSRFAVLAVAACHASAPAPSPSAPHDAHELLAWTASTYARAKTYRDNGSVKITFHIPGTEDRSLSTQFDTSFDRATGRFRLQYEDDGGKNVVWTEPPRTFVALSFRGASIEEQNNLDYALGAVAGVSHGLSRMIAPLLVPELGISAGLPGGLVLIGREAYNDRDQVWHLRANQPHGATETWIDAKTHAIVATRVERHFDADASTNTPAFDATTEIHYAPRFDAPLEVADLAGPSGDRPVHVQHAWVGVSIDKDAPRVVMVIPGAPADKAGVKQGDELVSLDGIAIFAPNDLPTRVRAAKVGDKVTLRVRRDGRELDLAIILEEKKDIDQVRTETLLDKKAPAFSATKISGAYSTALPDLAGHVVVVDFWATWCGPCKSTFPHLNALHEKYKDLRIIGISNEDEGDLRQFVADAQLGYTIGRDADSSAWRSYFVSAIPELVVIDKTGVVRELEIGVGDFDALEAKLVELMKR